MLGGMFYILENIKVKNIIIGIQAEEYENCKQFINLARKKKVKLIVLKKGDVLKIDKYTNLKVLFPDINNTIMENKINNNSLVFKFNYKNFSMLFTGDIEEEAEEYLVENYKKELNVDILKLAHHGSKTSSIDSFILYAKPKIVLIGVGAENNFGHPNNEVIKRCKKIRRYNL